MKRILLSGLSVLAVSAWAIAPASASTESPTRFNDGRAVDSVLVKGRTSDGPTIFNDGQATESHTRFNNGRVFDGPTRFNDGNADESPTRFNDGRLVQSVK